VFGAEYGAYRLFLSCIFASKRSALEDFLRLQFEQRISNGVPLVIKQRFSVAMLSMWMEEAEFAADLIKQARHQDERLTEAVTMFCARNKGANTFDAIGPLSFKNVILTEEQMSELFDTKENDGWQEFYKIYPESPGIITLSLPGFSKDGTLAVIYMG
jgi:hypothetical protein